MERLTASSNSRAVTAGAIISDSCHGDGNWTETVFYDSNLDFHITRLPFLKIFSFCLDCGIKIT